MPIPPIPTLPPHRKVKALPTDPVTKLNKRIGFIGLGIMGEGMACRLVTEQIAGRDAENPLVVWNRTVQKCYDMRDKYPSTNIVVKDTAREVVESCDIVFSMLSTPEAARAVFEGEDGVLAGVSEGKSIVDCATLAESDMKRMNEAVLSKGGQFLEAPVSGSKVPAATGTLIFLCAGPSDLFYGILDNALRVMGKASHYFGTEVGQGTRAKLVVNSLMGTMMAAYSEGLALAQSVDLDVSKIVEVIGQGAIQSPMYALKGPKMLKHDHKPNFPLKHAHKDMALACEMAKNAKVEYSVMEQAELLFRQAREDEELSVADSDFSAVYEKIRKESDGDFTKGKN
eukprot:CAMPEP_0172499626 /NCGR_PEP_ID=MMETSP1066-20121228/128861_1 /TAXON_ID=671091 /ORGANISM="Coscinodiscus wailesii, Strain CCMP2513" /LENGTH=340 /DNA_ID=CAMNT_0013273463 /DNA_START=125 /DNA_END=1147 /DNA_ORIENTATION=+